MNPQSFGDNAAQTEPWVSVLCAAAAVGSVLAMQYAKQSKLPPAPHISSRGSKFLKPALPYQEVLFKALSNKYSAENPNGCVPMLVAENNLSFDILRPEALNFRNYSTEMANYANPSGIEPLKQALADIMSRYLTKHPVPTEQLVVSAGLTAVLNYLFYCMCEEGDAVLIPTPYYSAFDFDVSAIARTVPIEVRTAHPHYELTDDVLDEAVRRTVAAGRTPKVLLLTNPHNPLGTTYTAEELRRLVSWARRNGMHIVSDEIYALSTYDESRPFVSVAEVLNNDLGTHVHILWALSKDFCMSGARCGVLYTQNDDLRRAVESMCMISQIPTSHQELLAHVLGNKGLVEHFVTENKRRLAAAAARLRAGLSQLGIPVLPSSAGLFVWADFRRALRAPTFEAEMELFNELYEAGVAFTPGSSQHAQEPGFFRICFAWPVGDALEVAIGRIESFLERKQLL